jgi:hypothetical protein
MHRHVGGSQSRKIRFLSALALVILVLTCIGFYAGWRIEPAVQSDAAIVDHRIEPLLFAALSSDSISAPPRPVYPHSVVPGGITSRKELTTRIAEDPVVAKHYSAFNLSRTRIVRARRDELVYVAYRMDDTIFWTKKKLIVRKGEELITDGKLYARARCGNRITDLPANPTSSLEPSIPELDPPPLPPDTPQISFPSFPSVPNAPVPLGAPPTTGRTYFPPLFPAPDDVPPFYIPSGGGPKPPKIVLPTGSEQPSWAHPHPTPASNVPQVPEPPTIWLAGIGTACTALRIWWTRHVRGRDRPRDIGRKHLGGTNSW